MDNPVFVDEKTIEMVHQDDDYDEYRTGRMMRHHSLIPQNQHRLYG